MTSPATRRAVSRGERVLPGLWRLRLPLRWPGIPHCNVYALAAGDGIVLVDTGAHDDEDGLDALEHALADVDLSLTDISLVVCTHAHLDHCGAAPAIVERTGCELWMHPHHDHLSAGARDLEADLAERVEVARQSGADERGLAAYAQRRRVAGSVLPGPLEPDRDRARPGGAVLRLRLDARSGGRAEVRGEAERLPGSPERWALANDTRRT